MADPIFPGRGGLGRPTPNVGVPTYHLGKFLPKLHENERNRTGGSTQAMIWKPEIVPASYKDFSFILHGIK